MSAHSFHPSERTWKVQEKWSGLVHPLSCTVAVALDAMDVARLPVGDKRVDFPW